MFDATSVSSLQIVPNSYLPDQPEEGLQSNRPLVEELSEHLQRSLVDEPLAIEDVEDATAFEVAEFVRRLAMGHRRRRGQSCRGAASGGGRANETCQRARHPGTDTGFGAFGPGSGHRRLFLSLNPLPRRLSKRACAFP